MIGKQRIALTSVLGLVLGMSGVIYILNLERIQRYALEWVSVQILMLTRDPETYNFFIHAVHGAQTQLDDDESVAITQSRHHC